MVREAGAAGMAAVQLATTLLQRARLAGPDAGLWEAADLQWWWRTARASDRLEQRFWLDDDGPVGAAVLTAWRETWGCDLLLVPSTVPPATAWQAARGALDELGLETVDMLIRDDDTECIALAREAGFEPTQDRMGTMWMAAEERVAGAPVPAGFSIVDRTTPRTPHPMRRRNGDEAEARLRQTSLYDPELDLAVETDDGETAGYALFWFDPLTNVGLVEPMRVEEAFQRRGLARALLADGLDRLARRGARRLKVSFETDAARNLYAGAGFRLRTTSTSYRRHRA